jgi:hypothetical protein
MLVASARSRALSVWYCGEKACRTASTRRAPSAPGTEDAAEPAAAVEPAGALEPADVWGRAPAGIEEPPGLGFLDDGPTAG